MLDEDEMTTVAIDPKALLEGRTIATLGPTNCPPGSNVVVGPAFYPKPIFYPVVRTALGWKPDKVGFWRNWPDKDENGGSLGWLDVVAWWNGASWEGSANEIKRIALPGVKQYMGSAFPGIRGREVWPDPAVVVTGVTRADVTVIVHDAPAEMVVLDGGNANVTIVGSANSVRVHGNRPMVVMKNGYSGRVTFLNAECAGQPFRVESGAKPSLMGLVRCLSCLSDAGGYIAGRGLDKQGSLYCDWFSDGTDLDIERLPRLYPPIGWGTAGLYFDDLASGSHPGAVRTQGFEYAAVVGGGSDNDLSRVTGGPIWVEDRSGWAQAKTYNGVPLRPYGNKLPAVAV